MLIGITSILACLTVELKDHSILYMTDKQLKYKGIAFIFDTKTAMYIVEMITGFSASVMVNSVVSFACPSALNYNVSSAGFH